MSADPFEMGWHSGDRTSAEGLREAMEGEHLLSKRGPTEERRANMLGLHSMHEDMGVFSDTIPFRGLNDDSRDRLIAHGRHDAAQTVVLATFILQRLRKGALFRWVVVLLLLYIALQVS